MNARIGLPPQLKQWLLHNIDRGIPPAPLARGMVEQGFDAGVAAALAHTVWAARAIGAAVPDEAIDAEQIAAAVYRREASRLSPANTIALGDASVRVAVRLESPSLAVLDDVLHADECAQLMALAAPRLAPSTIVDPLSGLDLTSASRSSDSMFFRPQENPLVARIDRRVSQLMNLPIEHGEGLQVVRYRGASSSAPHYDFLMPSNGANIASLARSGQRVSTLVMYLNDVAEGGETLFPESGFGVTPRRGGALYFEYCNSDGQLDPQSLHAAAPVTAGEKWIVTKWMRQRPFTSAG
ncbi:MAG TPA: 2-oxoglutarate-dependent dioxygenase [Janthinobacterium sp.]|nr:2-oxoglutarate-dependent dioxygenase [Janthinobacterium sp.]